MVKIKQFLPRRRAATKEGGRLRSTNATLPGNAASSPLGNLPGPSNATAMSGNDGRPFPNPGNTGENAEGGGTGTDNAEAGTSSGMIFVYVVTSVE